MKKGEIIISEKEILENFEYKIIYLKKKKKKKQKKKNVEISGNILWQIMDSMEH